MATIGEKLKAAREAKGVNETEAGAVTKILTKTIKSMEEDDFSVIAAPMYAKGFLRIYAEYLDLDPQPLVEEYIREYGNAPRRPMFDGSNQFEQNTFDPKDFKGPIPTATTASGGTPAKDLLNKIISKSKTSFNLTKSTTQKIWKKLPGSKWKDIRVLAGVIAVIIVLFLIINSISSCMRSRSASQQQQQKVVPSTGRMLIDEELPNIYLIDPENIEAN